MKTRAQRAVVAAIVLVLVLGAAVAVWNHPSVRMYRWSRASLLALEQTVAENPNDWRTQYWFGKRAGEAGDLVRAEPALRAAFGTAPTFLPAATELGKVLLAQGRVEEAFQVFRMVIGRDPSQKEAHLGLATLYRIQKAYPQALATLEKVVQEDPRNVTALYELAASQVGAEQPQEAEKTLRKALAIEPNNVMVLTALSRIRRDQSDAAEAESLARKAVDRAPLDALARLELARAISEKQPPAAHRKEALEVLKTARELAPTHTGILLEAARLLVAEERFPEATQALVSLVELDPRTTPAYHLLAECFQRQGRVAESRRAQDAFLKRQKFDQNLRDLAAKLADNPESSDLRFRIGDLYAADGQLTLAVRYYRNGLQRDPENGQARKRLGELVQRNLAQESRDAPTP